MQPVSDNQLRQAAHKRVDFRRHLVVYLVVNGALGLLWLIMGKGYFWPAWPMVFWGIGLVFHYVFDYRSSRLFSEEQEFEKLKRKAEGQ